MSADPIAPAAQTGAMYARLRGQRTSKSSAGAAFWRMLRLLRPHWRPLTLGLLLSFGVALTYAASLAGLLPVLNILIRSDAAEASLHVQLSTLAANWEAAGGIAALAAPLVGFAASIFPAPNAPDARMTSLLIMLGVLLALNIVGNAFRFASQYLIYFSCSRAVMDLRRQMYRKALHLPVNAIGDVSSAVSQYLSDVREVYLGLLTLLGRVAREPLKAICVFIAALLIDLRLTLVVIAIAPIAVGLLWFFGRVVRKAAIKLLKGYGLMLGGLEEALQGLDVVKGHAAEGRERIRMWRLERRMFKQQMRMGLVESLMSPLIETFGVLIAAAGVVWLASRTFAGEIAPSHFITMVVLLSAMLDPVRKVASVYTTVQRAGAASLNIFETLDRKEERTPSRPIELPAGRPPQITFDTVSFRYDEDAPLALDAVSLDVAGGECVALVGPNGSGKTTLARLLPRLLNPQSGRVTIDGVDVNAVSLKELRKRIAYVTQHSVIFARSVHDNIAYGKPDATRDEVRSAAERAYAAEFIERLPQGYDTVLGEAGMTLSGGQRQRLAIARAFLKPATILVFDEATSQIDADSERKIHEALEALRHGKTTFVIAHRHTVMDLANRIVVMDGGRVVDYGGRDELLRRSPLFAALYQSPANAT